MPQGSNASGCWKVFGIGCAVLFLLVATGIAGLWMSRDSIRHAPWFHSLAERGAAAADEFRRMQALRAALRARYPAEDVQVTMNFRSHDGVRTRSLAVTLVNPAASLGFEGEEARTSARAVARLVAATYPSIDRYDQVQVVFQHRAVGGGFTESRHHDFPLAGLRAPAP
jgi:hypothetical protein